MAASGDKMSEVPLENDVSPEIPPTQFSERPSLEDL